MKRLLICTDLEQKTVLVQETLTETENIKYSIVENPPIIEQKEGYIGKYALDENNNLIVVYTEIPKTNIEILKEENEVLKKENESVKSAISELTQIVSMLMP